ncbi:branched-chain amino acid ABC transporter permease [Haloechinothrix sp. LS1_15]|nr:branched-chain amino acid ABC transporter permease [Haloechinothrix sp. LS1_15]
MLAQEPDDPVDDPPAGTEDEIDEPAPPVGAPFQERLAQTLLTGLQYGGIIAICAVGLSLVFGTTRLINFAHGELVTFGMVVAFFFNAAVIGPGLHIIPATVLAVIVGALLGAGLDRGLWRPLRMRGVGRINMFIISIGLALLIRHLILIVYGSRPGNYTDYQVQPVINWWWFSATPRGLWVLGLSVIVLLAVALMLERTRVGTAIRAVADNRDLAASSGINVNYVIMVVWMLAGGLTAFGGVMFGLTQVVAWDMGFRLLLLMFAAIILGGLGKPYGAMVGGFAVGVVAHVSTLWFPAELQNMWAMLVLIVVLIVRPQGVLGRKERVG